MISHVVLDPLHLAVLAALPVVCVVCGVGVRKDECSGIGNRTRNLQ